MRRAARIAAALVLWTISGARPGFAQGPPEGWVVLSIDEYQSLRNRSLGITAPAASASIDATLSRVDYDLRLDGESIAGQALLTIDLLREGWARIPIPPGLMVGDARIDGQPLALVDGTPPYLLLSRIGRSVASLDLVVPLTASAGSESITLPPSPASIARISLVLPRRGVDLSLTGGYVAEHVETADESRWTMFGRPNEAITLSWKRRVDDRRSALPLRTRARITELVGYGEDTCQVSASVRVEVVQGLIQDITLTLPAGLVVNQVNGATVADWQTNGTTLRVRLLEAVSSETSFILESEMRAPRDGKIPVPIVRMPTAERETGGIAVDIVGAGEIAERQASGLEPADSSDLGDFVAIHDSPSLVAFRLRPLSGTDPRSLNVTIVRYTPQPVPVANVEEARYRALVADGRVLVDAQYAIRNNQRSFLKISLPRGASLWSASMDGQPIRPGVAEVGAVLLPLAKGRVGPAGEDVPTVVVKLVYLQQTSAWRDGERVAIELPAVDLPTSRTGLRLYYPPTFRITAQPGTFRTESDAGPFSAALRNPVMAHGSPRSLDASAKAASAGLQSLVDQFRNQGGERKVIGAVPVDVTFPEFGPSIFLASELTAESRAPSLELAVKRARD